MNCGPTGRRECGAAAADLGARTRRMASEDGGKGGCGGGGRAADQPLDGHGGSDRQVQRVGKACRRGPEHTSERIIQAAAAGSRKHGWRPPNLILG